MDDLTLPYAGLVVSAVCLAMAKRRVKIMEKQEEAARKAKMVQRMTERLATPYLLSKEKIAVDYVKEAYAAGNREYRVFVLDCLQDAIVPYKQLHGLYLAIEACLASGPGLEDIAFTAGEERAQSSKQQG